LEGFFEMYKKDPTSVSRILDIAQEAKVNLLLSRARPVHV
jgi:CCR4-NOT transcription complex subunit 1